MATLIEKGHRVRYTDRRHDCYGLEGTVTYRVKNWLHVQFDGRQSETICRVDALRLIRTVSTDTKGTDEKSIVNPPSISGVRK